MPHCGASSACARTGETARWFFRMLLSRVIFDAVEHLIEGCACLPSTHDDGRADPRAPIIQTMPRLSNRRRQRQRRRQRELSAAEPVALPPIAAQRSPTTTVSAPEPAAHRAESVSDDRKPASKRCRSEHGRRWLLRPFRQRRSTTTRSAATATSTGETDHYRWRPAPQRVTGARATYGLLSVLAVVASRAGAYFFRDELASRVPALAPALAVACEQLGCRLEPPRQHRCAWLRRR